MKIINNKMKLTNTELYLIDFINDNPDFFIKKTSSEIAQRANVSPSAITRLTQKLGFDNIKGLQIMVGQKTLEYKKIDLLNNEQAFTDELINLQLEPNFSMNQFIENIDLLVLQNIVTKILRAKRIFVFQNNMNTTIVAALTFILEKLGIETISNIGFVSQLFHLTKLSKNDVVLIFSSNFYNSDLYYLTSQVVKYELPLIIVSSQAKNMELTKDLLTWLELPIGGEEESLNELNYQIFSLMICKILYKELYKHLKENNEALIKNENILEHWNKHHKKNNS